MDNQKDNKVSYISAKTDKLAAAIYLVTGQLSDSEPLKWKLRDLAVQSTIFKDSWSFNLPRTITLIINLLDLGLNGSTVSVMNFTLLKSEYRSLLEMVEQVSGANFKALLTSKEVLPTQVSSDNPNTKPERMASSERRINQALTPGKAPRQDLIMGAIKGQGWLAIKDIAQSVPGFSVKTVQRELTELVEKGVVKKMGDRRWSRYSLEG